MVMKRYLAYIIIIIALLAIGASNIMRYYQSASRAPTNKKLQESFPEASQYFPDEDRTYTAISGDADSQQLGVVLFSDREDPLVLGYGGELSLLVGLRHDGRIAGVTTLKHKESPAYFRALVEDGYFSRFIDQNVHDDLTTIQAVSGATITSDAIKKDVLFAAREVMNRRYGTNLTVPESPNRFEINVLDLVLALSALVLATMAYLTQLRILRWISFASSITVFGYWLNCSISLPQFVSLLRLEWPTGSRLEPLILLVFAVVLSFLRRPVYCAQVCPFGVMQEIASKILPPKLKPSPSVFSWILFLRWILLFIAVLGAILFEFAPAASFEPFGSFFTLATPAPLMSFAALVLSLSLFYRRFWCRFLCPSGACLELIGKVAIRNSRNNEGNMEVGDAPKPS